MDNLKTIIDAWVTSFKPSDSEKELAALRREICDECPYNKEQLKGNRWSAKCTLCGCPISKKVYTRQYNPCPASKWREVDEKYYKRPYKEEKTLL